MAANSQSVAHLKDSWKAEELIKMFAVVRQRSGWLGLVDPSLMLYHTDNVTCTSVTEKVGRSQLPLAMWYQFGWQDLEKPPDQPNLEKIIPDFLQEDSAYLKYASIPGPTVTIGQGRILESGMYRCSCLTNTPRWRELTLVKHGARIFLF